jgi:hypothetical protein
MAILEKLDLRLYHEKQYCCFSPAFSRPGSYRVCAPVSAIGGGTKQADAA